MQTPHVLDSIRDDARTALRGLARSPAYAMTAVLTLGLGIGMTTAVFGLVRTVLLKPLPFADSERLVTATLATASGDTVLLSYPDFADLEQRTKDQQLAGVRMAFVRGDPATLRRRSGAEIVVTASVSADFFSVLRASPLIGRVLVPSDGTLGAPPVAVLSYRLWTTMFDADPRVIGSSLPLSAGTFTVVGVLRPGQSFPSWTPDYQTDAYVPLASQPALLRTLQANRTRRADSRVIARLDPATTIDQAHARLGAAYGQLATLYPRADSGLHPALRPMREAVVGDVGPSLRLVAIAVGLVLLLACANVANLTLARVAHRSRELAIRSALGAGAARVARYLIIESAIVALAGAVVGIVIAAAGARVFRTAPPITVPRLDELSVDWSWIALSLVCAGLATAICALAPAIGTRRGDLMAALRVSAAKGGGHARLRGMIVVAQIATAMTLLVGATLLVRSLTELRSGHRGFDPTHLILWRILPPESAASPAAALALYGRALQAAEMPGVEQVSFVNAPAIGSMGIGTPVGVDGSDPAADTAGALYVTVGAQYFSTMRIPILQGRPLTEADMSSGEVDAVVSRRAAVRYWPSTSPLGHHIRVTAHGDTVDATVVGVAGDVVREAAPNAEPEAMVYLPMTHPVWGAIWLVARTTGNPTSLIPALRRAFAALDPNLPVTQIRTGDEALGQLMAQQTFTTTVLSGFSGFALLLAAVGLFGLMSYTVGQRLPEIGIRMCLGARPSSIRQLILGHAAALAGSGVVIGCVGAVALTRVMRGLLYGVSSLDVATFITVAAVLSGIIMLACAVPLRRATQVDPISVLRQE